MSRNGMILKRETLLLMMKAGLAGGENRFTRQIALAWLAAFPGDLEVSLLQARAILAEGRPGLVVAALDLILRKDPEFQEAYLTLAEAIRQADAARYAQAMANACALGATPPGATALPAWYERLQQARQAVDSAQWTAAERLVQEALRAAPESPLAAVLHLKVTRATQDASVTLHLAQLYHTRWPDCLPVNLILAETWMGLGQEQDAVQLLHQCATHDAAGQTAVRLWGAEHPYRSLWLDDMVITFDQPIPAGVAARLGWNQLAAGMTLAQVIEVGQPVVPETLLPLASPQMIEEPACVSAPVAVIETPVAPVEESAPDSPAAIDAQAPETTPDLAAVEAEPARTASSPRHTRPNGALRQVENEFDRLAKKLKHGAVPQVDARYPVYVIFSTRVGLVDQYGPQTTNVIDSDLRRLAGFLRQRQGWDALVYYPDDPNCTTPFGLEAVSERAPWKLKLSLVDLDRALARRGEMIGAVLIVGGDGVVPFHRLPNPTDDDDGDVPSDNPYGARDANYFVTEWPVGRLPGEPGPDAGSLLAKIRSMQRYHAHLAGKRQWIIGAGWLTGLWQRLRNRRPNPSLGYTAAVWRRSSLAVFRPIGAPHTVLASPPEVSGSFNPQRVIKANLGYFNLHGTVDSSAWYGQRDPAEQQDGPDYPVALVPEDVQRNGHAPSVVFSEACYGGHVIGKTDNQSLALKFLAVGAQAVVASTGVSYGSVNTPLIAADLLGHLFWQHLKAGRTVGDALSQARSDLAREMNRRQGYLDGEDQKTLISFVLYGDPLASYNGVRVYRKGVQRSKEHTMPKTVCDRYSASERPPVISHEVLSQVKALVAEYLPGAELGDVHLSREHATCSGEHHQCPTADLGSRAKSPREAGRLVVTMSKQVNVAQHLHRHYIRVTLDDHGQPVKLALSR